jgi:hypothetical protein
MTHLNIFSAACRKVLPATTLISCTKLLASHFVGSCLIGVAETAVLGLLAALHDAAASLVVHKGLVSLFDATCLPDVTCLPVSCPQHKLAYMSGKE